MKAVSIVIPAYNAQETIGECLSAIQNLEWDGEIEVIVIDDSSTDGTAEITHGFPKVKVISIPHSGAARAMNTGIKAASHDIVVSVDSDAILEKDWLNKAIPLFDNPNVAAVSGYVQGRNLKLIGKITGYHTELRHQRRPWYVDAMGSANTAYRREALIKVGMIDEKMNIGYDHDIAQRLYAAGYLLILNKEAKCYHYWREDLKGYIKQQYGYAYSHLILAGKSGQMYNRVSTLGMVLQVPITLVIILGAILGGVLGTPLALLALLLLPAIHLPDTLAVLFQKRDWRILALPGLFTLRNLTWISAAFIWVLNQIVRKLRGNG